MHAANSAILQIAVNQLLKPKQVMRFILNIKISGGNNITDGNVTKTGKRMRIANPDSRKTGLTENKKGTGYSSFSHDLFFDFFSYLGNL